MKNFARKTASVVLIILSLVLSGNTDSAFAKVDSSSQQLLENNENASFVITAYFHLLANFYDQGLINRDKVRLFNAALDGVNKELAKNKIKFHPRYIKSDTQSLYSDFIGEFSRAVIAAKGVTLKDHALEFAATAAMFASIGDGHTGFIYPEVYQQIIDQESGTAGFFGIGTILAKHPAGLFYVGYALTNGPAYRAGIRDLDIITHVDSVSIKGLELEQVVLKIRGPADSSVKITVHRKGLPIDFSITRQEIVLHPVTHRLIERNGQKLLYVRILGFFDFEGRFQQYLESLASVVRNDQSVKGMVLDLRGNPGGYIALLCSLLDMVLDKGIPIYTLESNKSVETYATRTSEAKFNFPLVVIIDNTTGSAAEIFAAAMQEQKRATVVGIKSVGSVNVARRFSFRHDSCLMITTNQFSTSRGKVLDKVGVTPDVEVSLTQEDIQNSYDSQLEKAIEFLLTRL